MRACGGFGTFRATTRGLLSGGHPPTPTSPSDYFCHFGPDSGLMLWISCG